MSQYSFCETVTAGGKTPWHIRSLTSVGKRLGGGADTPALCGRVVAWDLSVDITGHHLTHCCKACAHLFEALEGRHSVKPEVTRRDENGDRIAVIHAYAPGDGGLSFVAKDPKTSEAVSPGPSREECEAVLPRGWELYEDGPYWRARRVVILS